uniref:Uncharacterized protein LOC111103610 n=1 Tax=Crassostrea virginica TaxID=6565 RepID=A0A8B8APZ5_CRAVI|nr:uncharacterized protein LOC111103610 [Crassostrea virginica]
MSPQLVLDIGPSSIGPRTLKKEAKTGNSSLFFEENETKVTGNVSVRESDKLHVADRSLVKEEEVARYKFIVSSHGNGFRIAPSQNWVKIVHFGRGLRRCSAMLCDCGGSHGEGAKFCPECGKKTSINPGPTSTVARGCCPNTASPGGRSPEVCGAEIASTQQLCDKCGWVVDPKTFREGSKMCDGVLEENTLCVNILIRGNKFCSDCGKKVEQA